MMREIKKWLKAIGEMTENRSRYFKYGVDEVCAFNLRRVNQCSFICVFLCAILFLITPHMYPRWVISIPYYMLMIFSVICWIISRVCLRKEINSHMVSHTATFLFNTILLVLISYIDGVENPASEAVYLPILFLVMPVIFAVPVFWSFLINLIIEIFYLIITYNAKSMELFVNDAYATVLSLVFSVIMSNLILNLRCRENLAKLRYKKMSTIDGLTNVLNKSTASLLAKAYFKDRKADEGCTLLIMDVDKFKDVNDKLGHQMGDVILEKFGRILIDSFKGNDIVGRVGGDEFMVLMKNMPDLEIVKKRCEKLNENVKKIQSIGVEINVTCSIGAVIINSSDVTFDEAFAAADAALYETKNGGRDGYVIKEI